MSDTNNIEERVKRLEELLLMKSPLNKPSPDGFRHKVMAFRRLKLKTDREIEDIDNRLEKIEQKVEVVDSDLGDTKSSIEDLDAELSDVKNIVGGLEETGISGEELTDRIKHYMKAFLRNSLGLEVSFDDKR